MFRIIPNALDEAITAELDKAFAEHPDAEGDREVLHGQLIDAFDCLGYIPEFTLQRKPS